MGEVVFLVTLRRWEEEARLDVESGTALLVLGELPEDLLATATAQLATE
jgi:hypothetical protein